MTPLRRRLAECAALAALLLALLSGATDADAQTRRDAEPVGHTRAAPAMHKHWNLPRLIYDARERRGLDAAETAARLGLNLPGTASGGPRFDGWLAGPGATHAWVSGTQYRLDGDGVLRPASAPSASADAGSDAGVVPEVEGGRAHLDRARGELILRKDSDADIHLRVGEGEDQKAAAQDAAEGGVPEVRR